MPFSDKLYAPQSVEENEKDLSQGPLLIFRPEKSYLRSIFLTKSPSIEAFYKAKMFFVT